MPVRVTVHNCTGIRARGPGLLWVKGCPLREPPAISNPRPLSPRFRACDDSLVQCIRELRDKLGDEGHRLIKTVHRRGYLLNVAVSTSDFAEGCPSASVFPVATTSAAASLVPSLDQGDRKARLSLSIANKPSIAVLPF
jgi:hypothetical protein